MSNKLFEITFADGIKEAPKKVQLLRAGSYDYWGEVLDITADDLVHMKKNFDDNVKQVDLAIDYYHASYSDAAGWIQEVILENNNTELWVLVDWTEAGKKKITDKELRYLSVDFDQDYKDNETGKRFGITLNGGGLTNRPFVKGMNPIMSDISAMIDKHPEKLDDIQRILLNDPKKETQIMDFNDIKKALVSVKLSGDEKKEIAIIAGIETNSKILSDKVESLTVDVKAKDEKIVELSDKLADQEKAIIFSDMVTNGKAVEGQKEAFLAGDMVKFAEDAVAVNLDASGSGTSEGNNEAEPKTYEEAEIKLSELADAIVKDDSSITFAEALKTAMNDNPEISKLVNDI